MIRSKHKTKLLPHEGANQPLRSLVHLVRSAR